MCTALGLPLRCGAADVATVEAGGREGLEQRPLPRRLQHRLMTGPGHPVDSVLAEGDEVPGFEVLEVPGHLAFWRSADRVLVLGDVLFNVRLDRLRFGLQLPPAAFTPDPAANLASARRLAALEPRIVCFGHGPPLRDGDRFAAFVAGLAG